MLYARRFESPMGPLLLESDGTALTGLRTPHRLEGREAPDTDAEVFDLTERWLRAYFRGARPDFLPPLAPQGTAFRLSVWKLLLDVPYGELTTYGAIADRLRAQGLKASPRAVGGAVGHNPIPILIPCHRVVGADGRLTGYTGGLDVKKYLLALEGSLIKCTDS